MADQAENKNQVAKLDAKLAQAKNVQELFSLPDVKERFIKNYKAVTGRDDGENRLEQERFAYMQIVADKPELKDINNFYHFAALVYAGTTGLSFRDNKLYVYPNGKGGLKVQTSPAGKREMFKMMPEIKDAPEAIIVRVGDHFIHDQANEIVKEHWNTEKTKEEIKLENIRAVYQRLKYKDGRIVDTVVYKDDILKAKTKTKTKSDIAPWNDWPFEMAKKVATNRAFRLHHRYPDNVVLYGNFDQEEAIETSHEELSEPAQTAQAEHVDEDTGEVTDTQAEIVTPREKKKAPNLLDD